MLTEQKYPAGEAIRSDPQEESGSENLAPEPVDVGTEFPQSSSAHLADYQIGRYLVGKRLGSGGAASVYQAYDQIQERMVALKILLPGADPAVHSRFRQEARTVARLRHPHIVQTFQVGDAASEGSAYIAMELVDGDSLAQLLKRRGRLSVAESCNLLAPIARALDYAHQLEIVHRDVKPSNILLRPVSAVAFGSSPRNGHSVSAVYEAEQILIGSPTDGENAADRAAEELPVAPLLSDFGIARALDMPELTNVGRTIGTPAYMAPEQCESSREVTGRADIYSLGAVLFRCLVGRPPFTGTTTQILHAHVYSSLSLPDDLLASLPSELVDVLRRSLAKTPQERFAFAKDMADDLTAISDRILSQESSLAEQTSTLTLVSLPSVQLPPSLPHTTDTVIIPGAESRLEGSAAQDIPPEPPKVQGAQHAEPTVSKRSRARLIATILGSVLVLALLAIGPAARNALQDNESSATTVSPSSDAAAPPSLSAAESQPVLDDSVESLATADNTASVPVETQPEATSEPPAALEEEAANVCQYQAAEQFESFLGEDESVAQELGCPKGVPTNLTYEIQFFQTGMALGRLDKPIVYIRYFSNDEWEQREHDWREGLLEANDSPNLQSPAEELFQPVRGIGQIWAEGLFVRQALGWAITQPKETNGVLQSFEGGLLIYNSESQDPHIFLKSQLRL